MLCYVSYTLKTPSESYDFGTQLEDGTWTGLIGLLFNHVILDMKSFQNLITNRSTNTERIVTKDKLRDKNNNYLIRLTFN